MAPAAQEETYKFLSSFSKYKSIYDEIINDDSSFVNGFCSDDSHTLQSDYGEECFGFKLVCPTIFKYMNKIKEDYAAITPECDKYLYYWIHKDFLTVKRNGCNAFSFYKIFLNAYCIYEDWDQCTKYINEMKYEVFERHNNLMHLYDIFQIFKNEEDQEGSSKCNKANECVKQYDIYIKPCFGGVKSSYCDELKNFKEDYEKLIAEITCENVTKILTSPEAISKAYITTISVVSILIVSIILYFLYKFTPFGSWLSLRLNKKKNRSFNIDSELNQYMHSSQLSDRNSKNTSYNVAYNSAKYS
ncbi:VIR protein [Plasmodium vivax]|uniref:VIR protein n=1 Tax=Plasmodium vivax TaxID=5855 RepID=A0A1G4H7V8_PLAVI|nr:VIR protein [Plasmodium vivax]